MSRPASEYTQAIRNLLDERDGVLTHAEARPLLAKLGFEIAVEPPGKSDAFGQFEQYDVDLNDEASVAKAMKACGFDEKVQKTVLREARQRAAFKAERNNFDVTKYNWSNARKSGKPSVSRKPDSSKNSKAKTAAVTGRKAGVAKLPKPKHRRNAVVVASGDSNDALDLVASNGGVAAVQAKVVEMRAEADRLEAAVNSVLELQKRVAAAA